MFGAPSRLWACKGMFAGVRTRASARDTLALALSHQGRGDSLAALGAWFQMAYLC